jgi:hypothetical protein
MHTAHRRQAGRGEGSGRCESQRRQLQPCSPCGSASAPARRPLLSAPIASLAAIATAVLLLATPACPISIRHRFTQLMHTATLQVASCKAAALAARAAAAAGPPDEAPPAAPKARENDELHLGFLFYTRVLGRAVFFRLFFLLFFACKFTWRVLAGPPRGGGWGAARPAGDALLPPSPTPHPPPQPPYQEDYNGRELQHGTFCEMFSAVRLGLQLPSISRRGTFFWASQAWRSSARAPRSRRGSEVLSRRHACK